MRILFLFICLWASTSFAAGAVVSERLSFKLADSSVGVRVYYPKNLTSQPRLPLIMMSHGWAANARSQQGLAHDLVNAGFIVAAVHHARDIKRIGRPGFLVLRPLELREGLTTVLNSPKFSPHINSKRIGAFGYSMGGYTVLAAAGGRYDPKGKAKHCANTKRDIYYCTGEKDELPFAFWVIAPQATYTMPKVDLTQDLRDPRIKAIALAAPVGVPFHDLNRVRMPVLIFRGTKDNVLEYPFHAEAIHKALPNRHEYILAEDFQHLDFLSMLPKSGQSKELKPIHSRIVAFFNKSL